MLIPPKPPARRFKGPVHWLLSSKLIAAAKQISLYANFGSKIDPKDWMRAEPIGLGAHPPGPTPAEFWFDYLADTGDGQAACYSMAYLALSDLVVAPGQPDSASLPAVDFAGDDAGGTQLPRGAFLFIGGDSCYHVADLATLATRLQAPWSWAIADWEHDTGRKVERRPLYGIPGNHDYYDFLDGFNRQFLKPVTPDVAPAPEPLASDPASSPATPFEAADDDGSAAGAPLHLPAFKRLQNASYVGLELPFGWRFLGLDAQLGRVDRRQRHFFRRFVDAPAAAADGHACRKLIVATPEPPTVFGQLATPDAAIVLGLRDIGLETPFAPSADEPARPPSGELARECCRLDIAGDIHHYARYWGPATDLDRTAYAAVVSGGGGAFLHPSETDFGEIAAHTAYPQAAVSRADVTRRLLNPWIILNGGLVAALGSLVAVVLMLAITTTASIHDAMAPVLAGLGLDPLGVAPVDGGLAALRVALDRPTAGLALLHPDLGKALLFMVVLAGCAAWSAHRYTTIRELTSREMMRFSAGQQVLLLLLALLAGLTVTWIVTAPTASGIHPLTASLLVVLFAALSPLGRAWDSWYRDALFQQAYKRALNTRDGQARLLILAWVVALPVFGVTYYGRGPFIAVLFDAVVILMVLGLLVAAVVMAVRVGAERHGLIGKLGFGLLGVCHASVQLAVPITVVLLTRPDRRGLWKLLALLAVVLLFALLATHLTRLAHDTWAIRGRAAGWMMLLLWIALVAAIVLLAITVEPAPATPVDLLRLGIAATVGLVLSCVLFGWYLAVALAFGGHNNEAGGAARLEKYRHFLRVRVTPIGVTVYAIAIDEPTTDGRELKPHLVDVFELTCRCAKRAASGAVH